MGPARRIAESPFLIVTGMHIGLTKNDLKVQLSFQICQ